MIAVIGAAKSAVRIKMKPAAYPDETEIIGTYGAAMMPEHQEVRNEDEQQDDISVANVGCGFNIAKHLAMMGHETAFVSVVGSDPPGLAAAAELEAAGVDVSGMRFLKGTTPVSVEMLNILGDTELYRSNESILREFTPVVAAESKELLQRAQIIVVDGFLPEETIEYIAEEYGGREDVKIFFDPASRNGGFKVKDVLKGFHAIMPGRMEAEAMAEKTILSEEQLMEAGAYFDESGISKTIITMKGGGLYYKEGMAEGILRPERVLSFADTSGAGDIVSAAVIAATLDGKNIEEIGKYAMDKAKEFLAECSDERPV